MQNLQLKKVTLRDLSAEELRPSAARTGAHTVCVPITACVCPPTSPCGDAFLRNGMAHEPGAGQGLDYDLA